MLDNNDNVMYLDCCPTVHVRCMSLSFSIVYSAWILCVYVCRCVCVCMERRIEERGRRGEGRGRRRRGREGIEGRRRRGT